MARTRRTPTQMIVLDRAQHTRPQDRTDAGKRSTSQRTTTTTAYNNLRTQRRIPTDLPGQRRAGQPPYGQVRRGPQPKSERSAVRRRHSSTTSRRFSGDRNGSVRHAHRTGRRGPADLAELEVALPPPGHHAL